jgi:hypothetical protein
MERIYNKLPVAIRQLDTSLTLFKNKKYFEAITLAGASEEILGKIIERDGRKATHSQGKFNLSIKTGLSEIDINNKYTNRIKNCLKHANNKNEDNFKADPKIEAIQYIIRGISNYLMIYGCIKSKYIDFLRFINKNNPKLFKIKRPNEKELLESVRCKKFKSLYNKSFKLTRPAGLAA